MLTEERCLIQIDGGDGLFFVEEYGGHTSNIQEAKIFKNELEAHIFVDKHEIGKIARVRRIVRRDA